MMKYSIANRIVAAVGVALPIGLALAYLIPSLYAAEQGFSSLEEQMTGVEFTAAGLQKLTPEELESLNQWIRRRSLATLDTRSATNAATGSSGVVPIEEMKREPIESRIVGPFSGWDGQAVFKLENGMIWAQKDDDDFYTREIQNPSVTIKPTLFGGWRLEVEGVDSECKVERIQ